jgi:hypothetical protein
MRPGRCSDMRMSDLVLCTLRWKPAGFRCSLRAASDTHGVLCSRNELRPSSPSNAIVSHSPLIRRSGFE